jgi:adenine phosphoribosyltransferase
MPTSSMDVLKSSIRDIPDFPKPGILFKDITTLLSRPDMFKLAIDGISERFSGKGIQKVVGIESRGFIFGAPIAYRLNAGIVPIRKKGKLPYKTISVTYSLEYGTDTLQMHEDAILPGEKILIVDDLLATGGTVKAAVELAQKLKADIVGAAFVIELAGLKGRQKLTDTEIFSLITF